MIAEFVIINSKSSLQREGAKLLRTLGKQRSSLDVLAGSVLASSWPRDGTATWTQDIACSQINAKSLLTMVKWLQVILIIAKMWE